MADRSDDIKQLFSHLGLNPGDYQELRDRNAATRSETRQPTVAPAAPPAPPVAPPTRQMPTVKIAPVAADPQPAVEPVAPRSAPAAAEVPAPVPVSVAPAVAAAVNGSTRWSLLRAAVETPTRVAQIDRAPAPPESAPTRRLFDELSRRPAGDAIDQLADAARRRWHDAAAPVTPTAAPAPAPAASQPVAAAMVPAPTIPQFEPAEPLVEGELLDTFRRLVAPPAVVPPKPARLHFKYSGESAAARPRQPREENLDDVFSRISDPRPPR